MKESAPPPDDLSLSTLRLPEGWTLVFEPSVLSTQDLARAAASQDRGSRHVFLADFQSAGRGRAGRLWTAPPGSALLLTVLLKEPSLAPQEHTMAVSVSVCEAIERVARLEPAIKWPNDVLIQDRKVCGVLAESTDASPGYVAVGLGLNVCWRGRRPPDVPSWATALDEHVPDAIDRRALLKEIVRRLDDWLRAIRSNDGHGRLSAAWNQRLWRRGQPVSVRLHGRTARGTLVGTDAGGALLLRTAENELVSIIDGELEMPDRPARTNL